MSKKIQEEKIRELKLKFEELKTSLKLKIIVEDFEIKLSDEFMDILFETMWTFINPDVIKNTFEILGKKINTTSKSDIDDDMWDDSYKNSLCFKGTEQEGHYVFVNNKLNVYGTYEKDLLVNDGDDGICHGVAMIYAYESNKRKKDFPIAIGRKTKYKGGYKYTRTQQKNLENYISILNFYKFLCSSDAWKKVVKKAFGKDRTDPWTVEKNNLAINTLEEYLNYLNSFKYD
jgi:hypothetical protein